MAGSKGFFGGRGARGAEGKSAMMPGFEVALRTLVDLSIDGCSDMTGRRALVKSGGQLFKDVRGKQLQVWC